MKYKIDYTDSSWLFFTPFAFLNMGGTNHWIIMQKRHWWNKWKKVGYTYDNPEAAYIEYFKLKYNLDIKESMVFPHNRKKEEFVTCHLEFKYNSHSIDYRYVVGYKPRNYVNYYHCCYSSESYELALMNLYCDMEIKKMLNKNIK